MTDSVYEATQAALCNLRWRRGKRPMLVDLSLDCEVTLPPEKLTPLNRLNVLGVAVRDYCVYSVEDQLADKLCAIMERQPDGWASSRMKDLADVVSYALSQSPSSDDLMRAISGECLRRSMDVPKRFEAPSEWRVGYASFSKKVNVSNVYQSFDRASLLASKLFDPVLGGLDGRMRWDFEQLSWR